MWDLGECVASDEATRGFKGEDSNKYVINTKDRVRLSN